MREKKPFKDKLDRRSFMRIMGTSLGIGALYSVVPALGGASAGDFFASGVADFLKVRNGEAPSPFTFVQLSDPHWGFNGPPASRGTSRGYRKPRRSSCSRIARYSISNRNGNGLRATATT